MAERDSYLISFDEGKRKNLTKNNVYLNEYKKDGYFFDFTQSDPKVVMKGIKLKSGELSSDDFDDIVVEYHLDNKE